MKIVTTTRTMNEEDNIARFVQGYSKLSDEVVVVDGGSEDDTVSIALDNGAIVKKFDEIISKQTAYGVLTRNPQGKHINACIQAGIDLGADWVIFDDADCVPTLDLQKNARQLLNDAEHLSVYLHRLYVYGDDKFFPEMNQKGHSLWAWKQKELPLFADESDPWRHHIMVRPAERTVIDYPNSVLHYFAPDPETVERKVNRTRMVYDHEAQHPLEFGGELADLPKWAVWK